MITVNITNMISNKNVEIGKCEKKWLSYMYNRSGGE